MQFLTTIAVLWATFMACITAQDTIRWAPGVLIGRRSIFDKTGNYIKYFKTTMTLGALPSPPRRVLYVWPGLLTENGDLVQSVAGSNVMGSIGNGVNCPNFESKWCLFAYTMDCLPTPEDVGSEKCKGVFSRESLEVDAGTAVDIEYTFDEPTGNWHQTMKINGQIVASLTTASGKAYILEIMTECQGPCHDYEIDIHEYRYTNTVIEFAHENTLDYLQAFHISPPFTIVSQVKVEDNRKRLVIPQITWQSFHWPAGGGRPIPPGGTEPLPGRAAVAPRGDKVYDRVAGLASPARMNAILGQA